MKPGTSIHWVMHLSILGHVTLAPVPTFQVHWFGPGSQFSNGFPPRKMAGRPRPLWRGLLPVYCLLSNDESTAHC